MPTRAAGISAMQAFIPAMGERYHTGRSYDHGPDKYTAVSVLSPYIRRSRRGDLAWVFQRMDRAAAASLGQLRARITGGSFVSETRPADAP
jgi:hypothetical protein